MAAFEINSDSNGCFFVYLLNFIKLLQTAAFWMIVF